MKLSELAGFHNFTLYCTIDKDSELGKYFFNIQRPIALSYEDIKKGKKFTLSYSYNLEEEIVDENTTKHEVITKTVPVRIVKIEKKKPTIHIHAEEI